MLQSREQGKHRMTHEDVFWLTWVTSYMTVYVVMTCVRCVCVYWFYFTFDCSPYTCLISISRETLLRPCLPFAPLPWQLKLCIPAATGNIKLRKVIRRSSPLGQQSSSVSIVHAMGQQCGRVNAMGQQCGCVNAMGQQCGCVNAMGPASFLWVSAVLWAMQLCYESTMHMLWASRPAVSNAIINYCSLIPAWLFHVPPCSLWLANIDWV